MLNVSNINNTPSIMHQSVNNKSNIVSKITFKQNEQPENIDTFTKENKKQKIANGIITGLSVLTMTVFAAMAIKILFSKNGGLGSLRSKTEKEALNLRKIDLSKIKERPRDSYSKEVQDFIDRFNSLLTRSDIEAKGGKRVTQVQLAGPGGTGKTDVAGVLAKKVEQEFPGSEYYIPDLSMLSSSSYKGQDVQMLTEYTQAICKRAEDLAKEGSTSGKKKYLVCFLDEFDKIAMESHGLNKADSNKTIGALKTLINSLMEHDNVILLSATNYPELIEGAVSSRVAEKVTVDYLSPKQIITALTDHYKNNTAKELVSPSLTDVNNQKLQEICEILGNRNHQMEYRKLFNNIVPNTLTRSSENGKIELRHLVEAITSPSIARELHLTPDEIVRLLAIVS